MKGHLNKSMVDVNQSTWRDGYTRNTLLSVNTNDRVDIARALPENLWDASSSACIKAGYLDFQKARCPGHSTSRRHFQSHQIFLATLFKLYFTFYYYSALLQRHLQQQRRRRGRKALLEEFSGLPPVQLLLFTLAAHSHHSTVRRTMTSSPTAFHWVNPYLTMENLTDGIHSPFLMSLAVEPLWRQLLTNS